MAGTSGGPGTVTLVNDRRVVGLCWAGWLCAVLVALHAATIRLAALQDWHADARHHFSDGRPVMISPDAYYHLRWAQAYLDGTFAPDADDPLRHFERIQYPRETSAFWPGDTQAEWLPQRQPSRLPLLSHLIAMVTPLAGNVEQAALYLTPILAALFVFPLYAYAAHLGAPVAGLLAGLVTSAAPIYFSRTGLGDVDTDCLNLFFPWLAAWTILCIRPDSSHRRALVCAAILGVVLHGYYSWYEKPALSLMYWGTLILHLLVQRRPATVILAALTVAIAFSNPVQVALCAENIMTLATRYTGGGNPADGLSRASAWFPNVMDTVVEYRSKGWADSLEKILAPPTLALLGLVAFGWVACRRWRDCVPLMPLLAISAFTFVSGPRFGMYLAPFVGLGLGIALSAPIHLALRQRRSDLAHFALTVALACAFFGAWVQPSARQHQMTPSISMPSEMIDALRIPAGHMPPGAAVWTWWDQGFALAHLFGFSVYHDGAVQYTPQTHVIAASLVGRNQAALSRTMDFVDAVGNRGIDELAQRADSRAALLRAIEASTVPADTRRPKFLLFTQDMFEQAPALRFLAGMPTETRDGESIYFEPLPCRDLVNNMLRCEQLEIDLNSGSFSDGRTVRRIVIVDGGRVVRATDFANGGQAVLELVFGRDRRIRTYRVPDALYASNLNRMFVLGEYDRALFEEVPLESDLVRLYRQKF